MIALSFAFVSATAADDPARAAGQGAVVHPRAMMGADGRSVVYDGEVVRLSRVYRAYEDYQADPNNIDPSENGHVEQLMTHARLPASFPSRATAFAEVMGLAFPGYGSWGLQPDGLPEQPELQVLAFEIPRAGKNRYVAISGDAQRWTVLDDFVAADSLGLEFVARRNGSIIYSNHQHEVALIHPEPVGPRA